MSPFVVDVNGKAYYPTLIQGIDSKKFHYKKIKPAFESQSLALSFSNKVMALLATPVFLIETSVQC
ncbi:MAG: hypothetical protein EOP48_16555 [Sphingobacteriales bacterium]|nr:MAG: hypothetical protein EOP48_16555 [Sphingobacteriales bacterium]